MANEAIKRAQEILAIEDVYLRSSQFGIHDPEFDPKFQSFELNPLYKGNVGKVHFTSVQSEEGVQNYVRFEAEMGLRLLSKEGHEEFLETGEYKDAELKAEVIAVFIAQYRLKVDQEIKKEEDVADYVDDVKAFGDINALFHVWPYWREYAHQTLSRLRIPEVLVPMFIPGQKKESPGIQQSDLRE